MDKAPASAFDNIISNWNREFPDYPLAVADLKKPQAVMRAFLQGFDRLGVDRNAVLNMPVSEEERDESAMYYWDLLPVINMTRALNHVASVMPQAEALSFNIIYFLQPTIATSQSLFLLMFNLMSFNEDRLMNIAPYEEELFAQRDQMKALEDKKISVVEKMNKQAQENEERAERLEQLKEEIKQLEEDRKTEEKYHSAEKQELKVALEEDHQQKILLEQKKGQLDAVMAEVAKKRALRVYDTDDIKAQVEQAAQNVREVEERHEALKSTLMLKENSLKNLQTIKPALDNANNLLHEIMKISENIKELESGDLDSESAEGELEVLATEVLELQSQVAELQAAREVASQVQVHNQARRQEQRTIMQSTNREEEERDRKDRERTKKSLQKVEEIKTLTTQYEREKTTGLDERARMIEDFCSQIKSFEDTIIMKSKETSRRLEDKLRNRRP